MAIKLAAAVRGTQTDSEGEGRLSFTVPASDYDRLTEVGKMVMRPLVLVVMDEDEFLAKGGQKGD